MLANLFLKRKTPRKIKIRAEPMIAVWPKHLQVERYNRPRSRMKEIHLDIVLSLPRLKVRRVRRTLAEVPMQVVSTSRSSSDLPT